MSDPIHIKSNQVINMMEKYLEYVNLPSNVEERMKFERKFPVEERLSNKIKVIPNRPYFNTQTDIWELEKFWEKFAKGIQIDEKDVKNLSWKGKAIFAAYLKRKGLSSKMNWTGTYLTSLQSKTFPMKRDEKLRMVLKMCLVVLMKDYRQGHFTYSNQVKDFLKSYPSSKHVKMGFLHKYFWKTKCLLGNQIEDFFLSDSKVKSIKQLENFLKLLFQSECFAKAVDRLTSPELIEANKGIMLEFDSQLSKKVKSKCKLYKSVFSNLHENAIETNMEWTKIICNDILFNPKCKLPWTFANIRLAVLEFYELKDFLVN